MPKKRKASHETKKASGEEINVLDAIAKLRVNYAYVILFLLICLGFFLRFYHIGYPVIGYHNWKAAHYITEARNFAREGFFKHGFFVPMRDTIEGINEPSDGEHNDTFPTISIAVGFLFRLFGESLFVARLANLLFSLATVPVFYLLIKELFEKEELALLSAFLMAINPMYVFFSHNVDVINPGIFFMVLGAYFYVTWAKHQLDKDKFGHLYLAALFVMLATITKYTFVIIAIPIVLTFPYRKYFAKKVKIVKPSIIAGIISAGFPAWFLYSEVYVKKYIYDKAVTSNLLDSYEVSRLVDFSVLWDRGFWNTILFHPNSYIADNFTKLGFLFAVLGALLLMFFFLTKHMNKFSYRFMAAYLFGCIAFVVIMGFKLSGHNYHQFPLGPAIIFFMAYFIEVAGRNVSALVKGNALLKRVAYLAVALLIIFVPFSEGKNLFSHSQDSRDRMYNTQFPGLDIAGDYINMHAAPDERYFHSSGQSFGSLWHAGRKGYKPPSSVEYFKRAEEDYNVNWAFAYQWGFENYCILPQVFGFQCNENQLAVSEYLKNNYRLVQMGFVPVGEQARPIFFLFRKGGTFNETQINSLIQGKPTYNLIYQYTTGPYEVRYINIE